MISIPFKRGDTFRIQCAVSEGVPAVAKDLTGFTIRSTVKKGTTVVAELTHSWVDRAGGTYQLEDMTTTTWPVAKLVCDIEYTSGDGTIRSTETFEIDSQADITTPVVP